MNSSPATNRIAWAAGIAAVVGPAFSVLPYVRDITLIAYWFLEYVWLMVFVGVIGMGLGAFAFRRGSKIVGVICVLTNIPGLAYYGFLVYWVAIGGSR
jgi:hypothetical protein